MSSIENNPHYRNESIDLFSCLSEKEKLRGKRKGIRMAKRENFFYKVKTKLLKHKNIKEPTIIFSNLLFRGKRKDNGEWVYGLPYIFKDNKTYAIRTANGKIIKIIPETLTQWTCFRYKEDKKLFVGDYWIDANENDIYVVSFRDGQYCFVIYNVCGASTESGYDETAGEFGECDCVPVIDYYIEQIEIAGNIYDNPEILKGE
jgi:hypothetical protein